MAANSNGFALGSFLGIDTSGGNLSCNLNIAGPVGLMKLGGNTLSLTSSNTYAGATVVSGGTLQVAGGGSLNVLGGLTLNPSTVVAVAGGSQVNLNGSSLWVSESACLSVAPGAVLNAGPTYISDEASLIAGGGVFTASGPVEVVGGQLLVNGAFSLGAGQSLGVSCGGLADFAQGPFFLDRGATATIGNGGTLQNFSQLAVGFSGIGNGTLTVDGLNTSASGGALLVGGGGASGSATFSGSSASTFNYMGVAADYFPGSSGTVNITSGATVTVAGALDLANLGSANGAIVVSGAGSQLIQTSSASAVTLGAGFGSASLTVANGALFSALGPIVVNSPATLNISGGSLIAEGLLAGNVLDNGLLELAPVQAFTYADSISGSGSLVIDGPASLILSGSNDYSGGTTVESGCLCIAASAALPAGGSLTVAPAGR